jgi:hypothetical protein
MKNELNCTRSVISAKYVSIVRLVVCSYRGNYDGLNVNCGSLLEFGCQEDRCDMGLIELALIATFCISGVQFIPRRNV